MPKKQPPTEHLDFVTAKDLAHRFAVTVDTVRRWTRSGRLPVIRFGKKTLRFSIPEVANALRNADGKEGRHAR
jgi:excisionase family DNA binding protein